MKQTQSTTHEPINAPTDEPQTKRRGRPNKERPAIYVEYFVERPPGCPRVEKPPKFVNQTLGRHRAIRTHEPKETKPRERFRFYVVRVSSKTKRPLNTNSYLQVI